MNVENSCFPTLARHVEIFTLLFHKPNLKGLYSCYWMVQRCLATQFLVMGDGVPPAGAQLYKLGVLMPVLVILVISVMFKVWRRARRAWLL